MSHKDKNFCAKSIKKTFSERNTAKDRKVKTNSKKTDWTEKKNRKLRLPA